jgi:hypothetical protein
MQYGKSVCSYYGKPPLKMNESQEIMQTMQRMKGMQNLDGVQQG